MFRIFFSWLALVSKRNNVSCVIYANKNFFWMRNLSKNLSYKERGGLIILEGNILTKSLFDLWISSCKNSYLHYIYAGRPES